MTEQDRFWVGPDSAPDTYQLVTCLGGGAEGEVWTAVLQLSAEGRRNVAVKILPPGTDGADEAAWINHGHLLRSMAHPGLVRVIDVFSGPAKHRGGERSPAQARYVVMDLVDGVTLREWLDDNPGASASQRLRTLVTVAAALDEMHAGTQTAVPVAHGDVKPSNIIIRPDGSTVLVDLGLTRLADGAGRVGRSRPYAAPELFQPGAAATPDTDRFAFAATVVHAFLGEPAPLWPEHGPDLNAVYARLQTNPLTARRPILINKVMEALAAPAGQRPTNLRTWLSGLTDTLSQVTESAGADGPLVAAAGAMPGAAGTTVTGAFLPAPAPMPVPARKSKRGYLIAAAALVVLLLVGAGVVYIVTRGHTPSTPVSDNSPGIGTPTPSATSPVGTVGGVGASSGAPSGAPAPAPSGPPSGAPSGVPSGPPSAPPSGPASPSGSPGPGIAIPITNDPNFVADSTNMQTNPGNLQINGKTSLNGFLDNWACGCNYDDTTRESTADIDLGRHYTTFIARFGIEDHSATTKTIEYRVYADGHLIYDKGFKLGQSADVSINVTGVLRLEIDLRGALDEVNAAVGDPRVE